MSYTEHKADKYGNVVLDGRHRYSTDPAYANCRLIVGAGAFDVDIYDSEGATSSPMSAAGATSPPSR